MVKFTGFPPRRSHHNVVTTILSPSVVGAILFIVFLGESFSVVESNPIGGRLEAAQPGMFDGKRNGARGFHDGIFDQGFGGFETMRKRSIKNSPAKRRPEMDSKGIHGDAFTGGFGDFYTMKRSAPVRPELLQEALLEGYMKLMERVEALERRAV